MRYLPIRHQADLCLAVPIPPSGKKGIDRLVRHSSSETKPDSHHFAPDAKGRKMGNDVVFATFLRLP
jgi:hypothetical protein